MANSNPESTRSSEDHVHRRDSLNHRLSYEDLPREDEDEDEDFAGAENDGIRLGLLSYKRRAGKERAVDGADGEDEEITTKQLAMSILGEVGIPFLVSDACLISCFKDCPDAHEYGGRDGFHWSTA